MTINFQELGVQPSGRGPADAVLGQNAFRNLAQRLLIVVALPTLLVVGMLIALAIRLSSTGPVLLRLTRENAQGQSYEELRFRCVWMDAPSRYFQSQMRGEFGGRDPRLTPVGDMLIRSGLNRLPRAYNVLMGHVPLSTFNSDY